MFPLAHNAKHFTSILVNATVLGRADPTAHGLYNWCNRSVITRRNLAVSDIYTSKCYSVGANGFDRTRIGAIGQL